MELANATQLADLGKIAFVVFSQTLQSLGPTSRTLNHADTLSYYRREYERFQFWVVDLGVLIPGHGSLDYRLRDAERLATTVKFLLENLIECLKQVIDLGDPRRLQDHKAKEAQAQSLDDGDAPSSQSGSDSDEGDLTSEQCVSILHSHVEDAIDRLYKLAARIRNPAARLLSNKAARYQQIDRESGVDLIQAFAHYDHHHISAAIRDWQAGAPEDAFERMSEMTKIADDSTRLWHRIEDCPLCRSREKATEMSEIDGELDGDEQAEEREQPIEYPRDSSPNWADADGMELTQFLIHRFARANNQRRQRFHYWRRHREKLMDQTRTALDYHQLLGLILEEPEPEPEPIQVDPQPPRPTAINALKVSDLLAPPTLTTATRLNPRHVARMDARSVVSVSEYAPSAWGGPAPRIDFPPAPKAPPGDKFFECPYCLTQCPRKMLSEKAWKAHLIHDMRPYVCTYRDCKTESQLYESRRDWIAHEDGAHRKQWRCPDHSDTIYSSVQEYVDHVNSQHPSDVDLMCSNTYLRGCEYFSSAPDRSCPICFISTKTAKALHSHLALHLERLAIFSLPRATENNNTDDDDVATKSDLAIAIEPSQEDTDGPTSERMESEWDNLPLAARAGDLERVELILREDQADFKYRTAVLDRALLEASRTGHANVARTLLDSGANIDAKDDIFTALSVAASYGHLQVVQLLLSAGAQIDAFPYHGDETALHCAVIRGEVEAVKLLLHHGASVNKNLPHSSSVLTTAAYEGLPELIQILLDHGAKVNPESGQCPLAAAAMNGDSVLVDKFLALGANINYNYGRTALHNSIFTGNHKLVQHLLEMGADPNIRHDDKSSSLTFAVATDRLEIARILIAGGADVDDIYRVAVPSGETPLHIAARNGNEEMVKLLINSGADINRSNPQTGTPLQTALRARQPNIVRILEAAGAKQESTHFSLDGLSRPQMRDTTSTPHRPPPSQVSWEWVMEVPNEEDPLRTRRRCQYKLQAEVTSVKFSPDGNFLAVGTIQSAWIYELSTQHFREVRHMSQEDDNLYVRSVCFSADGVLVATAGEDGKVRLWGLRDLQLRLTFEEHYGPVYSVVFLPNDELVASADAYGRLAIWNRNDGSEILQYDIYTSLTSLVVSPDSRFLVLGDLDKRIILLPTDPLPDQGGDLLEDTIHFSDPDTHEGGVLGLALSANGQGFYSMGLDKTLKVWAVNFKESEEGTFNTRTYDLYGHEDYVLSAAETKESSWIISGSRDKTVRIWNKAERAEAAILKGHQNAVMAVATSPTSNLFATGSGDATFTIWAYEDKESAPVTSAAPPTRGDNADQMDD